MKYIKPIFLITALLVLAVSCGEDNKQSAPEAIEIVLTETSVSFDAAGGTKDFTLKSTGDWSVTSAPDWIMVSPSSGAASSSYQNIMIIADENTGAERSADLKFTAGNKTAAMKVKQAGAVVDVDHLKPEAKKWYVYRKADKVENGKSYLIVADSKAAVPYGSETGYGYMNSTGIAIDGETTLSLGRNAFTFTAADGGYVISEDVDGRYIYLKDSYNSFQVGDKLPSSGHVWTVTADAKGAFSIVNNAKGKTIQYDPEYGTFAAYSDVTGILPSLYECIEETAAPVPPTFSTIPQWLELPATKSDDGLDFYSHDQIIDGKSMRSWSFDYDSKAMLARWIAYPLNKTLIGHGSRTDTWDYDPLVPVDQQPVLFKSFQGDWQRGHQLPSADRLNYDDNVKTFYFTNMTPQNGELNEGVWADLEQRVREWSAEFDTLYVVTGCSVEGSAEVAIDNDGKEVTVPTGYFKALLGYSKAGTVGLTGETGGYTGCAFWFDNKPYSGGFMTQSMTIAELEDKIGLDFFVNLDPSVAEKVEKTEDSWWK